MQWHSCKQQQVFVHACCFVGGGGTGRLEAGIAVSRRMYNMCTAHAWGNVIYWQVGVA